MTNYQIEVWYSINTFEKFTVQATNVEIAIATALKSSNQKATRITAKRL